MSDLTIFFLISTLKSFMKLEVDLDPKFHLLSDCDYVILNLQSTAVE